ncbi:hypothetical protein [Fervidobacterium sp.]
MRGLRMLFVMALFVIFFTISLAEQTGNFVLSIVPPHKEGFFVEFTSIGYSFGNSEISTQPLFDLIGAFNIKYRYYPTDSTVFNSDTFLWDPFFINKAYLGETVDPNYQVYVLLNMSHIHNNTVLGPIIIRPYIQSLSVTVFNQSEYVSVLVGRGFVSGGILLSNDIELFGMLEGGMLLNVWQSQTPPDDWQSILEEARRQSQYLTARVGGIWYYDRYSGIEIGYRLTLHGQNSPLRLVQGYSFTDWLYNYFNAIFYANPDQRISIPFITTDYYLSFSTKF